MALNLWKTILVFINYLKGKEKRVKSGKKFEKEICVIDLFIVSDLFVCCYECYGGYR